MPRNNRNTTRPKRVQIDETNNEEATTSSSNKSDKVSPTSKAKLELERRIASRPMDMQSHMKSLGLEILNHRRDHFNKKNIVKKMEEDASYIPQSARNKFTIEFSEATKARAPQRITELEAQAKAAVDAYQAAAKLVIIATCKEERTTHLHQIQDSICKAIFQITKTHLASIGITDCNPHKMVANLFAHVNLVPLVESVPAMNRNQLLNKYKTYHSLAEMPDPIHIPADPQGEVTEEEASQIREAQYTAVQDPSFAQIQDLLEKLQAVIKEPWRAFLEQHDENQRLLAVRKVSSELIENQATDATAMLVDNEAPINSQQMQDIIAQAVKKATQPLQQQLNQQHNQLQALQRPSSSKNNQRGSNNRSASSKKKSNSKSSSRKGNNTNNRTARGRSSSVSSRSTTNSSHRRRRSNSNSNRRGRPKRRDSSVEDNDSASSRGSSRQPRSRTRSRKQSGRKNRNSNRRTNRS